MKYTKIIIITIITMLIITGCNKNYNPIPPNEEKNPHDGVLYLIFAPKSALKNLGDKFA